MSSEVAVTGMVTVMSPSHTGTASPPITGMSSWWGSGHDGAPLRIPVPSTVRVAGMNASGAPEA